MLQVETSHKNFDDGVDEQILEYLNPEAPQSFFLFAGAGSGKTRSLKNVVDKFRTEYGENFRRLGKKIAIITYTNAAADEIIDRLGEDELFPIKTIHSFCWQLIKSYQKDIQIWQINDLKEKLEELTKKQKTGKPKSQSFKDREKNIKVIEERLILLKKPRRFIYNIQGDNFDQDAIAHADVLKIAVHFILNKPVMRNIFINQYPFLLIDESQDTNKALIDALLVLEEKNKDKFAIGLFGDTMQRIYNDGHENLEEKVPKDWARPAKRLNHRSPKRIIVLGNALRADLDGKRQCAREDSEEGFVGFFIAPNNVANKPAFEQCVQEKMAELTKDPAWKHEKDVKKLTLEHHMAAARLGFAQMYNALRQDKSLRTSLATGELAGVRFFAELVAPIFEALKSDNKFKLMAHLRQNSPLYQTCIDLNLKNNSENSSEPSEKSKGPLAPLKKAVTELAELYQKNTNTTFLSILQCVARNHLFPIPFELTPFIDDNKARKAKPQPVEPDSKDNDDQEEQDSTLTSLEIWREFLETPFNQIFPYKDYINKQSSFSTHQSIKGLEFDRVLVILDDEEARGFLFSYEQLFGIKTRSTNVKTKPISEESRKSMIERTQRLFYVTCTRAKKSLAIIAYSKNPENVKKEAIDREWFSEKEIFFL